MSDSSKPDDLVTALDRLHYWTKEWREANEREREVAFKLESVTAQHRRALETLAMVRDELDSVRKKLAQEIAADLRGLVEVAR